MSGRQRTSWMAGLMAIASLLLLPGSARASDYYWMGTGTWANVANWASTPAGAGGDYGVPPASSDNCFFLGRGSNSIIETDYAVLSLTVSNFSRTVAFSNDTAAALTIVQDFYLGTGCTLTVTRSSTNGNGTGRVITVGNNAVIKGKIDGDYKGFNYQSGPGAGVYNSRGASHGGRGGKAAALAPYGSLTQPTSLGSGGGAATTTFGGGAVKLVVSNALALDGTITVRGANDHDAASGGSIWLVTSNFSGAGTLDAGGGRCLSAEAQPGGSGGRIALEYTNSTYSGNVTAAGGLPGPGYETAANQYLFGQPGTLWEPGRLPSSGNVTISGGSYQYWLPAGSTQNWDTVTVSNLDQSGMVFLHNGTINIRDLVVNNATLRFDINDSGNVISSAMAVDSLAVTGSLTVASSSATAVDAGYLYLPSRGTYALTGDFSCTTNTIVYALGDTTATNAASGGSAGNPHGAGVTIQCLNALINGQINGDYQGFPATNGPGAGVYNWYGASHGGMGSRGGTTGMKAPYGSLTQPTALGSGGGMDGSGANRGGGAIKIAAANSITHNGSILMRGQPDHDGCSGGSIWLVTTTLSGNGTLNADGGNCNVAPSQNHGSGSGGRISIQATNSTYTGFVSAAAGLGNFYAQPGTLWQPGRFTLPGNVTLTSGYQYFFDSGSTQVFNNLTIANPDQGGAVCFHGGNVVIGDLLVSNANLRFDVRTNGVSGLFDLESLTVTGSITVAAANTNWNSNAVFYLPQQGTYALSGDLTCRSNATLYVLGDTNAVNADSGGLATNKHGAGPAITAANAYIDGTINGDGLGFPEFTGPAPGANNGPGASHGGKGGSGSGKPAKAAYGALSRPTALGSGGGQAGGAGGSAIKLITTNTMVVNGSIVARGIGTSYDGAAGGSIWLKTKSLSGGGNLIADGDTGGSGAHPDGGGGRIAIEYVTDTFSGLLSAKCGPFSPVGQPLPATGTWFYCQVPLDDRGITVKSDFSVSSHSNGVKITRTLVNWNANRMEWNETSTEWANGSILSNTATYTMQGLLPNRSYKAYDNGVLQASLLVDEAGTAPPFSVVLTGGTHTVMVQSPQGTVFVIH